MPQPQLELPFAPGRNVNLFSTHWLAERLRHEPEWGELGDEARSCLDRLAELWTHQRDRVERYGDEQGLEQAFIQPVLSELGWQFKYQAYLDRREPDYAFFLSEADYDAALQAGRKSPAFWDTAALVGDAKAWHISLDKPTVVRNAREYPPQQIEWYLDRSRCGFGLLTNGQLWRLVPRSREPHQPRFETYYEFNLAKFLDAWLSAGHDFAEQSALLDDFRPFHLFFGPSAYREIGTRKRLVVRALEGSSEYRLGIGETLPDRAFEALRLCIEGFLDYDENGLSHSEDLELCRSQSFVLLYRLLFVMYAEDRGLLPYDTNRTYRNNRSLRKVREEVSAVVDRGMSHMRHALPKDEPNTYQHLLDLFDLINRGHRTYGVPAYNGGLFDDALHPFLHEKSISDWHLAQVIDKLSRAEDPEHPDAGQFRVDYRDLAIQHLGGIYEGLLELQPKYASKPMVVVAKTTQGRLVEKVIPRADEVPAGFTLTDHTYKRGEVYLETHKGERRASGSYYTPDHIVNYIVEQTLGPLCKDVSDALENDVDECTDEAERLKLQTDYDDRILALSIVDPSMGSGHFLIGACQYLAEEIATHHFTGDPAVDDSTDTESALTYWKRKVAETVLYGVDINPLAVELAKLGLWLETVSTEQPLTFLDHHLRCGNSITGCRLDVLGVLPADVRSADDRSIIADQFREQLLSKVDALLDHLEQIRSIPSDTTDQVHQKQRLFRSFDSLRLPFLQLADLWSSTLSSKSELTAEEYQEAIDLVQHPKKFASLMAERAYVDALRVSQDEDVNPFHWQLEFPDVFLSKRDISGAPAFDAVIGNPPYDVLSEQETGRDLTALRSAISANSTYDASATGKNNLYKLFICLGVALLKEQGRLGYITPMTLLGDKIVAEIRKLLIGSGNFTSVDAFPQKDDRRRRVFRDAKLSTTVFTWKKNRSRSASGTFVSRAHPANVVDEGSAHLELTTEDIGEYDPANFTILSASQEDWNVVTEVLRSERMQRLSDVAEFFQGEVNETNERKRGALSDADDSGVLVTRGAGICLYVLRPESQGDQLYIDQERFLAGKAEHTKAYHYRHHRIGLQESSPQNNFRRLIAADIPPGHFCNHKINYAIADRCRVDLSLLLALLNSKFADWYFRLGSSNNSVSHYQLYNIPCPRFGEEVDQALHDDLESMLNAGDTVSALDRAWEELNEPPFDGAIEAALVYAANRIRLAELERGEISRTERAVLGTPSQPYQDFIDGVLFRCAGIGESQASELCARLEEML